MSPSGPTVDLGTVTCAVRHHRQPQPGFAFIRRVIPSELIIEQSGLRYTSVALTALDLREAHGGDAIDRALRRQTNHPAPSPPGDGAHR